MKLTKIETGVYSFEYAGFDLLARGSGRKWEAVVKYQGIDIVDGNRVSTSKELVIAASSKKEAIELGIAGIDCPSKYPQLHACVVGLEQFNYIDNVQPDYVAEEYAMKIASPFVIKRLSVGGSRYYCTIMEDEPQFYMSVTSCTAISCHSPQLIEWRIKHGEEGANRIMRESAAYGTLMHIVIGEFIKVGSFDFDTLEQVVVDYVWGEKLPKHLISEWITRLYMDMLAFGKFCEEKKLQVVAVEFPIVSDKLRLGGCIDLVCKVLFNGKMVNAIIDFKSGRKGFYETHELQLLCYRAMWNSIYREYFEVTHIFNWAPKDWRNHANYTLKNQTNSKLDMNARIAVALSEGWTKEPKPIKRGVGVMKFGQPIEKNTAVIQAADYLKAL